MHNLTFLDPRKGLEAHLRTVWEEFFKLSKFINDHLEEVNLNLDNALKHIAISDPTEALHDPRYEQYFKDFLENSNVRASQYIRIFEDENGQLDWEAPICPEAWNWLWFITYTAVLTRLDGLYLTGTIIERKAKKGSKKKRYFYLKWVGILYGENIRNEEFAVFKLSPDGEPLDNQPRKWKFDRKVLSLGYIPIQLDEKFAKKIKTGKSLEWYLDRVLNDQRIKKARLIREVFYLLKLRWKEIQILERLFPILRSKRKKLPYPRWLDSSKYFSLAINIVSLKRLLYPELEEKHGKWFEFWETFC